MRILVLLQTCAAFIACTALTASGVVLGTNPPSQPLTMERIATLPSAQRAAWKAYLERSQHQMAADKAALAAELKAAGVATVPHPAEGHDAGSMPLNRNAAWYSSPQALHIADVILSFQTPAGGWSKNLDMAHSPRLPGQSWATGPDATARYVTPGDYGTMSDTHWSYIGTIDNNATTTQIRFLAKVTATLGPDSAKAEPYRKGCLRGIDYLLAAQYPNGGWPQVWPLEGGYHDNITYNDDAMIQVLELLHDVAAGAEDFTFVPATSRKTAGTAVERGIQCILKSQIVVEGRRTAWCQQVDPLTLAPASARNYEMPSKSAAESANILLFLMAIQHPTVAEIAAISSAGDWLTKVAIYGHAFRSTPNGRALVPAANAPLLWARYYQIGTDKPLFGDRDKTIHDTIDEISLERRNGYSWYNSTPQRAVTQYAQWHAAQQTH